MFCKSAEQSVPSRTKLLSRAAVTVHSTALTLIHMKGNQFSSRSKSNTFSQFYMIINDADQCGDSGQISDFSHINTNNNLERLDKLEF